MKIGSLVIFGSTEEVWGSNIQTSIFSTQLQKHTVVSPHITQAKEAAETPTSLLIHIYQDKHRFLPAHSARPPT